MFNEAFATLLRKENIMQTAFTSIPATAPFYEEIYSFLQHDHQQFPATGGIVFAGSSSIAFWTTIQQDLPFIDNLIPRGFGGSTIEENTFYADFIITPYSPNLIVLYAGTNDLACKNKPPAEVCNDFQAFVEKIQEKLPDTQIAFISIHLCPARQDLGELIKSTNEQIRQFCSVTHNVHFLDTLHIMQHSDSQARPELFTDDEVHLSASGYREWAKALTPPLQVLLESAHFGRD